MSIWLENIKERYERELPLWACRSWAVMALQGLEELKRRLESGDVSWDRPVFAFYSLLPWDFTPWESQGEPHWSGPSLDACYSMIANGEKPEAVANTAMGFLFYDFLRRATFSVVRTNGSDGKQNVIITQELDFKELPAPIREYMEDAKNLAPGTKTFLPNLLLKPFRFGITGLVERFPGDLPGDIAAAFLQLAQDNSEIKNAADFAEEELAEVAEEAVIDFMEDILSFTFTNHDMRHIEIKAVVEISPVFVEPEEKRASFPVVVGLEATEDGNPVTLEILHPEERESLWGGILEILQRVVHASERLQLNLLAECFEPGQNAQEKPTLPARLILDGTTRRDSLVQSQLSKMNKVKLPRRWESIPRWEDLVARRLDEIRANYGPEEAERLKLLKIKRKGRKDGPGEESYELTKAESEKLRDSLDGKVFREERNDPGRGQSLAIVKRIQTGDGTLEVAFSWYGMDWKLVEGGRDKMEEAFVSVLKKDEDRLFPELTEPQRDRLRNQIEHIQFLRDSERLMGLLVDRFGQAASNVFSIPLWELKALFECEHDPHAMDRINGAFFCLTKLEFVQTFSSKTKQKGGTGYGPFLVFYQLPAGRDGDVIVEVSSWAIGALRIFEKGRKGYPYVIDEKRLEDPHARPSGEIVEYDFSRKLERDKRKELSKALEDHKARITHKDTAVIPHLVNALARGDNRKKDRLTRLLEFMATELTRNRDPRRDKKPPDKSLPPKSPRLYDRFFCPLLEGRRLAGALAHQKHNPESGRTLYGGSRQATSRSGGAPEGLLSVLNYEYSSSKKALPCIRDALLLMLEVVEDTLDGLVALKSGEKWERARDVLKDESRLAAVARDYRVHLFFPENYTDRLHEIYNQYQEERARTQNLPYIPTITKDPALHRVNNQDRPGTLEVEARVSRAELLTPLHEKLQTARNARGLTQKQLGALFGVSDRTVKFWENFKRDDLGEITKGRPIPKQIIPFLERWLKDGTPPTKEEMNSFISRRKGHRKTD
jgi:hypothetical protein